MRYLASEDAYSVYLDRGVEVYLAHGTRNRLVAFNTLDLYDEWRAFPSHNRESFLDSLREKVIDPDAVDEIYFCQDCDDPHHSDNGVGIGYGTVCETCMESYYYCESCEEYRTEVTDVQGDIVCDSCVQYHYSYCDYCNEHYHDDDSYDHDHDNGCDCEAPAQRFTVRNDGEEPLANDTRATVSLPAGEISDVGVSAIMRLLRDHGYSTEDAEEATKWRNLAYRLDELGSQWQTKQGNYTKRLSRLAYKELSLKVTPDILSTVGTIAREHSTGVDFAIEVTRDLNLPAEDFAHADSCWWQSYSESRCTLKSNGGFGLRTFSDTVNYYDNPVKGRAWVMPVKLADDGTFEPTIETMAPDGFVVFNGYGDLSGYTAARIVAHMAGMTYRKVGFHGGVMYVNGDSGYLVASEEIASNYTDGNVSMRLDQHESLPLPTAA